jgi:hypothetical protein
MKDADPPRLMRFKPRLAGYEREIRHVSMVPEVHSWLLSPVKDTTLQALKAGARTHFAEFVKENPVDDCDFMKQVQNRWGGPTFGGGIWSVRPRFEPQHRFFGVFALPDWLLVFNKQSRSKLAEHQNRWRAEYETCLRIWTALFPGQNVYTGTKLNHYVTRNASHRDDRWYPV